MQSARFKLGAESSGSQRPPHGPRRLPDPASRLATQIPATAGEQSLRHIKIQAAKLSGWSYTLGSKRQICRNWSTGAARPLSVHQRPPLSSVRGASADTRSSLPCTAAPAPVVGVLGDRPVLHLGTHFEPPFFCPMRSLCFPPGSWGGSSRLPAPFRVAGVSGFVEPFWDFPRPTPAAPAPSSAVPAPLPPGGYAEESPGGGKDGGLLVKGRTTLVLCEIGDRQMSQQPDWIT